MPLHESDGPKPDDDREPSLHDSTPVRAAAMVMGASLAEGAEGRKSSRPPALDAAPNPITLLRALQRRWILALSVGILGAAAAGIAAYCVVPPPKLTACSRLNICAYLPRIIFETGEQRAVYTTYQKTQVALIKSRRALQAALGKAEVAGLATVKEHADAVEWLEEELKVSLPGGAEILEISLSGKRAEDLAILVNAVTDSYLKMIEKVEHAERTERLEKLKKLYEKYQAELEAKRKKLRLLAETVGSNDKGTMALKQQYALEQLALAKKDLMQLRSELRRAQMETAVSEVKGQATLGPQVTDAEVEARVEVDPGVEQYRARMVDIKARMADTQKRIRNANDPALQAMRRQYETVQMNCAAYLARLRRVVADEFRAQGQGKHEGEIADSRVHAKVLQQMYDSMAEEIERLNVETRSFNHDTLDLQSQQDEILLVSETAKKVGAEVEAMEVEIQARSRITLLDRAVVPNKKDVFRKAKAGGAAAAGTFTFVLFGISYWEFRARRINSVDEVVHGLGLRLVGALPTLPNDPQRRAGAEGRRLQGLMVESIDAARTLILHASRVEAIRMVMIVSAVKGEGKTSLACHLATSLARAGRRTLLIDGDLRSPAAHRLFDLPPNPGLSEVLRGEVDAAAVIRPTPARGLHLLPAGRCDALAIQALAQDRTRALFEELKGQYDFIIVDSAPVLLVADSLLISHLVDAVIFSILRDVSRVPLVYAAYERLAGLGARTLGAVVSGTSGEIYGRAYQYAAQAEG